MKVRYVRGGKELLTIYQEAIPRREDAVYLPGFVSGTVESVKWFYSDDRGLDIKEPYVELRLRPQA